MILDKMYFFGRPPKKNSRAHVLFRYILRAAGSGCYPRMEEDRRVGRHVPRVKCRSPPPSLSHPIRTYSIDFLPSSVLCPLGAGFLSWEWRTSGSTRQRHTPTTSLSACARSSSTPEIAACARSSRTTSRLALRSKAPLGTSTWTLAGPSPLAASKC
jgi:hypothetical protein